MRFKTVPLGTVASVRSGYAFKSVDWQASGIPVVKISNVKEGRLILDECSYVSEEVAHQAREFLLSPGDILIGMTGYVGDVAMVNENRLLLLNQRVGRFTVTDLSHLDPRFLFYSLRHPDIRSQIRRLGYGSAQPNISPSLIQRVGIPLPPLPEQRAIAHILGTLDDKIELNRKMNATLDEIARTLFTSWFVDFDPVRAKAEGRQPEGMDAETAALFPDRFVDSTLGPIPEGWEWSTIGKEVSVVGGSTPSTSNAAYWDDGTNHWATPRDLSNLQSPMLIETDRRITDAGVVSISSGMLPKGAVLLSSRAPVGYIALAGMPMAINQGFIGMVCNDRLSNYYVLNWTEHNLDNVKSRANGSTFQEISKRNFRPIPVVVPSVSVIEAFGAGVAPFYSLLESNLVETRTLVETRDTLLPELLSGRIQVPVAEQMIGAV